MDEITVSLTRENLEKEQAIACLKNETQQTIKQMKTAHEEAVSKMKQAFA